jgi:hypothetical protein
MLLILLLLILALFAVVIRDIGEVVAYVGHYIINLFHNADLNPNNSGFNEFFQLIMIAVFIGWTIYRFKRMRKK